MASSSIPKLLLYFFFFSTFLFGFHSADESSHVLTLDATNFEETVAKHPFIVVEFYTLWCGHCKKLEPEYEAAAATLSKHDPPIVLAKVDVDDQKNIEIASKYNVHGYPTLKIFKSKGEKVEEYNGPREANGIVEYLKRQVGPASVEIKCADDSVIDAKKIHIVGIFPEFSGQEYDAFMVVAEKLRSDYDFGHTLAAKFLPKGEPIVKGPTVRLLKPFDEFFVDFQDFDVDTLEKFIAKASTPLVTILNADPINQPFIEKYFGNKNDKAMLFMYFSNENFDQFMSHYSDVAKAYKEEKISFLIADLANSSEALEFFGLKEDQVPLIIIQTNEGNKYLKTNLCPTDVVVWFREYMDGKAKPYKKSQPIPEVNDEPVKVIVGDHFADDIPKNVPNVLIEFYSPSCIHCQKLAPILDEVAISFEDDPNIIIAKLDATANDFPKRFEVNGFPTIYFTSSSGKHLKYDGNRTKGDIINFIQTNRDTAETVVAEPDSPKDEL